MKHPSDADDTLSNKRQEVEYYATFEKITSCKVALGKVISDKEWVCKIRKAVDKMTQMRVHGTRAFSDYVLYAVMNRRVSITTSDELINIIRAYYIANTNTAESRGRKSTFLNERIDKEWNNTYRRKFNNGLLNKEGLGDIITFDVKDYATDVKNYLTKGLRDHFVRLVNKLFTKDIANDKYIAALRLLKICNETIKAKSSPFNYQIKIFL